MGSQFEVSVTGQDLDDATQIHFSSSGLTATQKVDGVTGLPEANKFIVTISQFKARWDIWRTIERHNVSSTDFLLLENRANEVLKGELTLERVVAEAKDIARQFERVGVTPLTPDDVMGLIFSMAVQSEAL